MNLKPISEAKDPDLRHAVVAMQRAAEKAKQIAIQSNTDLVVVRQGVAVKLSPQTLLAESAAAKNATSSTLKPI